MPTSNERNSSASPLFTSSDWESARPIAFSFDDMTCTAPAGITIAAALLLNGVRRFRATPVSASPRAPYCMMGVCFECLVEVDGKPARQSCLTAVQPGMVVRSQEGAPAFDIPTDLHDTCEANHDR